jgi:hypothetical protein
LFVIYVLHLNRLLGSDFFAKWAKKISILDQDALIAQNIFIKLGFREAIRPKKGLVPASERRRRQAEYLTNFPLSRY